MFLHSIYLILILVVFSVLSKMQEEDRLTSDTLYLVHILFRHGERTPQRSYPKDNYNNYSYFPYGYGALTNRGKDRMYSLGKSFRKRYTRFWRSAVYNSSKIEAKSSAFPRTRMSCQLVLAGMFQPSQLEKWNPNLNWQPTLCDYVAAEEDYIFLPDKNCKLLELKKGEMERDRVRGKFDRYKDVFKYLSTKSGLNMRTPSDVTVLYDILRCQNELGLELPHWADQVFPKRMSDLSVLDWSYNSKTEKLRRLGGGVLFKTIVDSTQKKINNDQNYVGKKFFLYSGHDTNLYHLMAILDIKEEKIMPYGTTVMVEIHLIKGRFIVKIYLQDRNDWNPRYVPLSRCKKDCTWDKFVNAYKKYFATEEMCRNNDIYKIKI